MRAAILITLVMALAGCFGAEPASGSEGSSEAPGTMALPEPAEVLLALQLQDGVPWNIAGLVWSVENATTAVILVHGHSGAKENQFHTLPQRGSSFGAHVALTGRTTVAIDLPGYGGSDGDPEAPSFEVFAEAVRATARSLRNGDNGFAPHERVVAYGISMGATIVNMAASGHDDLDAIIPAAWPVSPRCDQDCPDRSQLYNGEFFIPNIDWAVANATLSGYEQTHYANTYQYRLIYGPCTLGGTIPRVPTACEPEWPVYREIAARVQVPVFTWVGDHDWWSDISNEPDFYPESPRVDTWFIPNAGHYIHNHLTQDEMVERLDTWLGEFGY